MKRMPKEFTVKQSLLLLFGRDMDHSFTRKVEGTEDRSPIVSYRCIAEGCTKRDICKVQKSDYFSKVLLFNKLYEKLKQDINKEYNKKPSDSLKQSYSEFRDNLSMKIPSCVTGKSASVSCK
jgi:hypothetical protein